MSSLRWKRVGRWCFEEEKMMSNKKSQKVNVSRKVKEDLKNDSSNVGNTKIELPQLPQPFLIRQEEQNKPWYKKTYQFLFHWFRL